MKQVWLFAGALALSGGLLAYGVSPRQYTQGQSAPQPQPMGAPAPGPMPMPVPGNSMGPGPQPVPGNALAPGNSMPIQPNQPNLQLMNQPTPNYETYVPDDWAKEWKHYHFNDAKKAWETPGTLFVDARGKSEYDQSHIPGAIPLPLNEFDKYYPMYEARLKKAKLVITYCHGIGCKLSDKVAQKLFVDHKFKNVGAFFGGWPQWQQHNMPIETGATPKPRP